MFDRFIRGLLVFSRQFPWIFPRGIITSADKWIRREQQKRGWYASLKGDSWQKIYPETIHTFCPPRQLQHAENAFRDHYIRRIPPVGVCCFRGAYLFGDQGAVLSRDNRLFDEFVHHFDVQPLRSGQYFRPFHTFSFKIERRQEWIALLAAPESRNHYHWLFDVLPRLKLLEEMRAHVEKYALPQGLTSVQVETLSILGISAEQILSLFPDRKIYCERLLVPSLPASVGSVPQWSIEFLRNRFGGGTNKRNTRRKIYLSRSDADERRLINEAELVSLLMSRGFEVVELAELSFPQQVGLFREAETVVGCHGAGFANLVFAEDCQVVEMFSPQYFRPDCYFTLCRQLGHEYRYMVGSATGKNWGDITISPRELTSVLE